MSSASTSPISADAMRIAPRDPLRTWRRRLAVTLVAVAVALVSIGAWALKAPPQWVWQESPVNKGATTKETRSEAVAAVDRAVFEKSLWVTFQKPGAAEAAAAETQKRKELPLEVDLIGVSEFGGALVAALYDRRADRLFLLKSGESIAVATVAEVTRDQVTLKRGSEQKVLIRRRPGP